MMAPTFKLSGHAAPKDAVRLELWAAAVIVSLLADVLGSAVWETLGGYFHRAVALILFY